MEKGFWKGMGLGHEVGESSGGAAGGEGPGRVPAPPVDRAMGLYPHSPSSQTQLQSIQLSRVGEQGGVTPD